MKRCKKLNVFIVKGDIEYILIINLRDYWNRVDKYKQRKEEEKQIIKDKLHY